MMKLCTCATRGPRECPRHRDLYQPGGAFHGLHGEDGLVPGYLDSPDGLADARDQRREDAR